MKQRSVLMVIILSLVTFGIYPIFWLYFTKEEMRSRGADIPTFILAFIPFINIYWTWKYCEGVGLVTRTSARGSELSGPVAFLLLVLLGIIGMAIIQNALNGAVDAAANPLPAARVHQA